MTDTTSVYIIRGQHFRKPAPLILNLLPAGFPLYLTREPTNEHDTNAIMVWIDSMEDGNGGVRPDLVDLCNAIVEQKAEVGSTEDWEVPAADSPFHLGYIGKEFAEVLAPVLDTMTAESGTERWEARLSYTAEGKPAVEIAADGEAEPAPADGLDVDDGIPEEFTGEDDTGTDPGDFSEVDVPEDGEELDAEAAANRDDSNEHSGN